MGLVSLLRAAWLLATLPFVAAWLPLPSFGWLRRVLLGFVKRGKILQSNTKLTVPQRFFSHFYLVGILWTTMLLIAVWFYAITKLPSLTDQQDLFTSPTTSHLKRSNLPSSDHVYDVWLAVFLLLLMEAQVLRRFYESVNVFNYSPLARLRVLGYFGGVLYYIATPLSLCCNIAPEVFEFVKKNLADAEFKTKILNRIMSRTKFDIWVFVAPFLRLRWFVWIGAAIFLWGWVHQLHCHKILGSLRNKPEQRDEYVIPCGDWFEYVSSPHYTAEIVIYAGLLVASGGADLTLWLLFAFVVANLGLAASITHTWYLQKFDDYPRNRCAIFPFVY